MDTNAPQTPSSPDETLSSPHASPIQDRITAPPRPQAPNPARPQGPNAAAVALGLVALLLAGLIIANETIGLRVDWSRLGPGVIVGVGLLFVVLGAIGLVRRHDDA